MSLPSAFAQRHTPPPHPAVTPFIGAHYASDADGDRIDDQLLDHAQQAIAADRAAATPEQKSQARAKLDGLVNVELIFNEPVTQRQLDTFEALGGEITYVYKAVSYGWNARLPLNKVSAVPAAMGATLVLVNESKTCEGQLNLATRTGRVRPIWATGFAGSPTGFTGNSNTTIAILDGGVDESHSDLNGRRVFWHDYTMLNYANPTDVFGHGSHVAGIALGTGASAGSGTGTLKTTYLRNMSTFPNGNFSPDPMELPLTSVNITCKAVWNGGDTNGTRLRWFERLRTNSSTVWSGVKSIVGTSPLTLTLTTNGLADRVYSPGLLQSNGITDCVITTQIGNYPGVGDGFNKLRGVASGCNWAGAKVIDDNNHGLNADIGAGLDDLVANRTNYNIKIMNLSLGGILDATFRQKINSAVDNGIVVAVAAGNSSTTSDYGAGVGTNFVTDPGRAAMALTVGAVSSINQVTDYSREGFYSPSTATGQEEDYKPDLVAPGGSAYQAKITSIDSNNGDGTAFADQQTNDYRLMNGTSMATPFAAGCAALVIQALEENGVVWDYNSSQHSRLVKMLLCATATESNTNREGNLNNPTLQRATSITNDTGILPPGKDLYEGYGIINPDAAVEGVALLYTNGVVAAGSLGPAATDRRAWARRVSLPAGRNFNITLTNPAAGDFDLYLYSGIPSPYGTPLLLASSTQSGTGVNETLNFFPLSDQTALLVVKRVSGSGTFSLIGNLAPSVDFAADLTNGATPLAVSFTNLSISATDYLWDFGEGSTSTEANPLHIYTNAGGYTVTLTAIGPGGTNSLAKTAFIAVTNLHAPAVDFSAAPRIGFVPLTVYFTNLAAGATSYLWSFGDGQSSIQPEPPHTYAAAGTYDVTLEASGLGGSSALTNHNYIVVAPLPSIASPAIGSDGFTFSFETVSGIAYEIEYTDSLTDPNWQPYQSFIGDGTSRTVTNSLWLSPERYYRLRVNR